MNGSSNKLLGKVFALVLCSALMLPVFAEKTTAAFSIEDAESELIDGVYHLNARLGIRLGDEMREALRNGVPLVFVLELEVIEPRLKWLKRQVVQVEQRYELRYHALSQQYLLTNLNTGIRLVFHNLAWALDALQHIERLPLLDADVIEGRDAAQTRLRLRLDVSALPLPLKIRAYTSPNWQIRSDWVPWPLS